jgi:hypothetical protein
VNDDEWRTRRSALRDEALAWREALQTRREVSDVELPAVIGSVAHTAYHLGALRQMQPSLRGPRDATPPRS